MSDTDVFMLNNRECLLIRTRIWRGTEKDAALIIEERSTVSRPSRLAEDIRRNVMSIRTLQKIVISDCAPGWDQPGTVMFHPKGLTTIFEWDKKGARELWYRVTTPKHRAAIYLQSESTNAKTNTPAV